MSSILDQVVQVGVESTYGTAVAPTRAYEAKADTFTRDVEYIQSIGFRRDMQTIRSDRDDTISLAQAAVTIAADIVPDALPGTQFSYGGLSMHVGGRMAEVADGRLWDDSGPWPASSRWV